MFPIADQAGHMVGFGGRVLGSGEPKYLNSGESEVFAKRNLLYGLSWAKGAIRRADRLFIVEGYFDVIRIMLAGIEEVVAPLGTALTEAQAAALVRKYTKTVYTSCTTAISRGSKPRFGRAMSFWRAISACASSRCPTGTTRIRSWRGLVPKGWRVPLHSRSTSSTGRSRFSTARGTSPTCGGSGRRSTSCCQQSGSRQTGCCATSISGARAKSRVFRASFSSESSNRCRHRRLLRRRPSRFLRCGAWPPALTHQPERSSQAPTRERNERSRDERAVRELLRMLVHLRQHVETVAERDIGPESFANPVYGRLFEALVTAGPDATPEELAEGLDEEETTRLQELLSESGGLDRGDETVLGAVNALLARQKRADLVQIDRDLPLAEDAGKDDLLLDKGRVTKELRALGQSLWKGFNSP